MSLGLAHSLADSRLAASLEQGHTLPAAWYLAIRGTDRASGAAW